MAAAVETTFINKTRFLGIYIITSALGLVLIVLAVLNGSRELEVINEVNNMDQLLGVVFMQNHSKRAVEIVERSGIRLYRVTPNGLAALSNVSRGELTSLSEINLEATRVNARGGYYELDGNVFTWVKFKPGSGEQLLAVHQFMPKPDMLLYVYRQRMVVPMLFYIWLFGWVAFIFHRLLQKLKQNQERINFMALHDELTGLPNRNLVNDRLQQLIQSGSREGGSFSRSLIDLNGFKAVNDKLGHAFGDEILRQVAVRLKACLRQSDTAARIGGDEFVILLNHVDEASWHVVYTRLYSALCEPYNVFGSQLNVGASIGVAIFSGNGSDARTLMRNADSAMYVAKQDGGGIRIYRCMDTDPLLSSGVIAS